MSFSAAKKKRPDPVEVVYSDGMWIPSSANAQARSHQRFVQPGTSAVTRPVDRPSTSAGFSTPLHSQMGTPSRRAKTPSSSSMRMNIGDLPSPAMGGRGSSAYDERTLKGFEEGLGREGSYPLHGPHTPGHHSLRPTASSGVTENTSVEMFLRASKAERKKKFTTVPKSKIPKSFFITEETTAPLVDAQMHTIFDSDRGVYRRTIFPTKKPSSTREEVMMVRAVLADMLAKFVEKKGGERIGDVSREVLKIYSVIINEVVRQEAMQSSDRAHLLSDLWSDTMMLFEQVLSTKNNIEKELVELTARVDPLESGLDLERKRREDAERAKEELELEMSREREMAIKGNGLYGEGGLLQLARNGQSKVRVLEIELESLKIQSEDREQQLMRVSAVQRGRSSCGHARTRSPNHPY